MSTTAVGTPAQRCLERWSATPAAGVRVLLEGQALFGYWRPVRVRLDVVGCAVRRQVVFGAPLPRPLGDEQDDDVIPAPPRPSTLTGVAAAVLWNPGAVLAAGDVRRRAEGAELVVGVGAGADQELRVALDADGAVRGVTPTRPGDVEAVVLSRRLREDHAPPSHVLVGRALRTEEPRPCLDLWVRDLRVLTGTRSDR